MYFLLHFNRIFSILVSLLMIKAYLIEVHTNIHALVSKLNYIEINHKIDLYYINKNNLF